jgi:hypothetical protein
LSKKSNMGKRICDIGILMVETGKRKLCRAIQIAVVKPFGAED